MNNDLLLYKRPTPKYLWVWITLSALILIYLVISPHGDGKTDLKQVLHEQQLHDARTDLNDAQRRLHQLNNQQP